MCAKYWQIGMKVGVVGVVCVCVCVCACVCVYVCVCVCVHSVHMHAYTCVLSVLESADRTRLVTFPTLSLAATPAMWKCTHTVLSFRASHTSTRRSTDTFCM